MTPEQTIIIVLATIFVFVFSVTIIFKLIGWYFKIKMDLGIVSAAECELTKGK